MQKIPLYRKFALLLLLATSVKAMAVTGVAMVHGTAKQTDAYNDYWKPDMIESVRKGLSNPSNLLVVNCDFSQYMWKPEASGCLATQLYNFITSKKIDDLVINTHSNGGNVIRWILSNPTRDSRHPTIINAIRWVNAIAPTSAGTPLADAVMSGTQFEAALGWLLGYQNDAVRMQQTSWMANYNSSMLLGTAGRPRLPVPFYSIVGTNVVVNPFKSSSYCGEYQLNLGLKVSRAWLDSCSDGFINCDSQKAAGSLWFYDKDRTKNGEVLSHAQSRRACSNLDVILRNDI